MTWTCIEITSGIVSAPARNYCGNLAGLDFENIGDRIYFVEAVHADGSRFVLHDGFTYDAALIAADNAARLEGLPVRVEMEAG